MKILIATKNEGKVEEIKALLEDLDLEILTLNKNFPSLKLPPESYLGFEYNALTKARYTALNTGVTAIADDSGLEVDALGGMPGVRSARYAGPDATDEENCTKLLEKMKGIPPERRTARFRCVIALVAPSGRDEETFEGTLEGVIGTEPRGSRGFGYDPIFVMPETGKTLAELSPEEKNRISHRAKALNKLKKRLAERLKQLAK